MSLSLATARRLVEPVFSVVFPSRCAACGRWLVRVGTGPLCEPCWTTLPRHHAAACRCGLPLLPGSTACGHCRRGRQPFAAGTSLGPYEGSLRVVLQQLKYAGRRRAAARLARLMLEEEGARQLLATSDLVVPVPLHERRLRERGFNQSSLLAAALAHGAGRPCCADVLVRRRPTATQTGLSAADRRRNVRGAFAVRRRAVVAGRIVTLVDDVLTTGATVQACALVLRECGVSELRLLTVARA